MSRINLFLCGDVMTGRGIDQILPYPCDPVIYEPWVSDAREYVALAEMSNGPVPRKVDFSYIWGDAMGEMRSRAPDFRIINLETSVTTGNDYWRGKGINYRMSPSNFRCTIVPFQIRNMRLNKVNDDDMDFLYKMLNREGKVLGSGVRIEGEELNLVW